MASSHTARVAPRDAHGDPQKIEQLAGRLDFKHSVAEALRKAENLAALVGEMDPALVAGLAFALLGGPRQ
ncbi:hypothetical protein [Rhodoblastus sp.]|uniref:hypothetical protein n=1 Tax=Rhodoblastus sp. TaxID=1962975 RepID=UPI003F9471E0